MLSKTLILLQFLYFFFVLINTTNLPKSTSLFYSATNFPHLADRILRAMAEADICHNDEWEGASSDEERKLLRTLDISQLDLITIEGVSVTTLSSDPVYEITIEEVLDKDHSDEHTDHHVVLKEQPTRSFSWAKEIENEDLIKLEIYVRCLRVSPPCQVQFSVCRSPFLDGDKSNSQNIGYRGQNIPLPSPPTGFPDIQDLRLNAINGNDKPDEFHQQLDEKASDFDQVLLEQQKKDRPSSALPADESLGYSSRMDPHNLNNALLPIPPEGSDMLRGDSARRVNNGDEEGVSAVIVAILVGLGAACCLLILFAAVRFVQRGHQPEKGALSRKPFDRLAPRGVAVSEPPTSSTISTDGGSVAEVSVERNKLPA